MRFQRLRRMLATVTLCAVLLGSLRVSAAAAFQDVPSGHWAADEIQRCVELGFFNGQTETRFGTGQSMTRAAFTVVLCRFFGWETAAPARVCYADVPADAWYAGAVESAYQRGVLTRQQETFRPNDPITREELTVMLVRAMGYGALAGLSQDTALPFTDVTANIGYIALAHTLGLVNGTASDTFSPNRAATREQVAVIFMRLYDKLHRSEDGAAAILSDGVSDLCGISVAAIPAARLLYTREPLLNRRMDDETAAALRDTARQSGAQVLLHVTGGVTALKGTAKETAAALAAAVAEGEYDGLFLDIPQVSAAKSDTLTALAAALREALGDRLFYLTTEAPARESRGETGYDYAALSRYADRLVIRVTSYDGDGDKLAVAPVEPLEEVYYALETLSNLVPARQLTLLVTTEGSVWENGTQQESLSAAELQTLLESGDMTAHYSDRYACAYLTGDEYEIVWYLNSASVAAREQLVRLFGAGEICLSDLSCEHLSRFCPESTAAFN